jgi:hypothetical protein
MSKLVKIAMVICAVAIASGCSTTPVAFVDKSVPMEQGRYSVIGDEVEGSDTQFIVLGFGLGLPGSPQRRALSDAMSKVPSANGLISMAIDQQCINLNWVQIITTRVTGTPVKTR